MELGLDFATVSAVLMLIQTRLKIDSGLAVQWYLSYRKAVVV